MTTHLAAIISYVSPEVKAKIEQRAKEEDRTVSKIVARLLTEATQDW